MNQLFDDLFAEYGDEEISTEIEGTGQFAPSNRMRMERAKKVKEIETFKRILSGAGLPTTKTNMEFLKGGGNLDFLKEKFNVAAG